MTVTESNEALKRIVTVNGREKQIRVIGGDICAGGEEYDVVVCSAFKNNYDPIPRTLIGALERQKGISVRTLSEKPEIDLKGMGAWLSRETGTAFRRVACVELLDLWGSSASDAADGILLQKSFSTLRFLLEQAALSGIPVRRIALPILGSGNQGIPLTYIAVPLVAQAMKAFNTIDELESVDIFEIREEKTAAFVKMVRELLLPASAPEVFVSYNSKQASLAHEISGFLDDRGCPCWIAPESIPTGSDYAEEIPLALSRARVVLLVLTEDAMRSPWVIREVSAGIGAGKAILPCQIYDFSLDMAFSFYLSNAQIYPMWKYSGSGYAGLYGEVKRRLDGERRIG